MTAHERVKRARAELAEAEREFDREEERARQVVYPNGFRVEARRYNWDPGYWELKYSNGDGTYSLGLGVRTRRIFDRVRPPEPPDGWALARANGKTHIVYWKTGTVFCTSQPKDYMDEELVWAVIPIPLEE